MTHHVALATCADLPDGDPDDLHLIAALNRLDVEVSTVAWGAAQDWSTFGATVIRSTWDYTPRRAEFLAWTRTVPRLCNPPQVIAANSDKRYLADLSAAGLPVVPTAFLEPDDEIELPTSGEYVLKPSVGAGSRGVGRFDAADPRARPDALDHIARLRAAGRTVLLQPYQAGVDTDGESALIFVDGVFSHSIRKGPMLAPDTRHRLQSEDLFVAEHIEAREADSAEIELAERAVSELSHDLPDPLLYARIDLLPGVDGPVLVEAELIEPSLFFEHSPTAADRFAAALVKRLGEPDLPTS